MQQRIITIEHLLSTNGMGKPMPPGEIKHSRSRIFPLSLLINGAVLTKKSKTIESSKENSLDFHLEMIKKIDALLERHEHSTPVQDLEQQPPIVPSPPPVPIEPRPLFKTPDHTEIAWQPPQEPSHLTPPNQPEEFKTELTVTPEFKFITSREFTDAFLNLQPRPEDRIEIIDLSLFTDSTFFPKKRPDLTIAKNHRKEQPILPRNQKLEIINAGPLNQKTYKDVFVAATKQKEDIENKSQIYYMNSRGARNKKQQRIDFKQSYIPVDFDERSKQLRAQQQAEKEQQQQQDQKRKKQLEREQEKLAFKKEKLEEKKHDFTQKQKKENKKESPSSEPEGPTRRQLKEQKQLERIEARKQKIEEKKRRKEEKHALKEKQKQHHMKKEKNKKQKSPKEKTSGFTLFKKDKHPTASPELDDEIKKVLLMADSLLEELPEETLNKFVQSEDFELYERVLNKYKIK
jgi:hypothetical protein